MEQQQQPRMPCVSLTQQSRSGQNTYSTVLTTLNPFSLSLAKSDMYACQSMRPEVLVASTTSNLQYTRVFPTRT